MSRNLERVTLLVPAVAVTLITLGALLVVRQLDRPSRSSPAVQEAVTQLAAASEKAPVTSEMLRAVALTLADVEGVGAIMVDGKTLAGTHATQVESQICTPIHLTQGTATLCAEIRPPATPSLFPLTTIALAAIISAFLAASAVTLVLRRSVTAMARGIDDRLVPPASGSLGVLSESIKRLLNQVNENDVTLRRRTLELESANKELESFSFSASHDLRAPLASIEGFTQMLLEDFGRGLDESGLECVHWIRDATLQMQELVNGLLQMSRFSRADLEVEQVDLSELARSVIEGLRQRHPEREVAVRIQDGIVVRGDARLLRAVFENLLSNAWKFTSKRPHATIEFGTTVQNGHPTLYVRDDGAGFDSAHADKMFRAFQRLHSRTEFEGTGIGLATVQRILHRHGGKIWAEGEVEKGATFYFTTGPHEDRMFAHR